ncbi:DUF1737 domain-containing protein [Microbulbifer sp. OS29]|uniref:DUF1737 domain-containing protein n=1 Tax=Microbulbifer okhotskensis TaxID=2926617 RepID=A0A9X2J4B2_9GAMM|nr:DUF1737 domain-containing protein [Microbulbifer okhotskensis]MCO1334362.1 DUF1737 domain-containing protein [Microbulbifer okhotskensis]
MKKAEYMVAVGKSGFTSLEEKVSQMLNEGWKPVGGLAFNAGYPYQAMARVVTVSQRPAKQSGYEKQTEEKSGARKKLDAQEAMRLVDELT